VVGWLDAKVPHDPRVLRLLDFVLPTLITALLVVNLLQLGRVGGIAEEARNAAQTAQRASRANHHFAAKLRQGLVENCQNNGNPLREVLIEEQEGAIEDPHDPRIHALLPNTPQSVINKIVAEGNKEHRERTKKLTPVNCTQQYPEPGSGSPGSAP
jgi:hypothetical protein